MIKSNEDLYFQLMDVLFETLLDIDNDVLTSK